MEKYIYKITNKINNKVYIGQTNNPRRRFQGHKNLDYNNEETQNKLLYIAIKKYGVENFSFEVIEGPIKNYNEREIYWIKYYNTNANSENGYGYNMADGGEEPPLLCGETNPNTTHTAQEVDEIKHLLKDTDISIEEIALKFNYYQSSIIRINQGIMWHDKNEIYPLRLSASLEFNRRRSQLIKNDLMYTEMTQKEISKKYDVSRSTITAINIGTNDYDEKLDYPLRKKNMSTRQILQCDKDTGEVLKIYDSISQAKRDLKVSGGSFNSCLKGRTKTAYGYIWKYKDK